MFFRNVAAISIILGTTAFASQSAIVESAVENVIDDVESNPSDLIEERVSQNSQTIENWTQIKIEESEVLRMLSKFDDLEEFDAVSNSQSIKSIEEIVESLEEVEEAGNSKESALSERTKNSIKRSEFEIAPSSQDIEDLDILELIDQGKKREHRRSYVIHDKDYSYDSYCDDSTSSKCKPSHHRSSSSGWRKENKRKRSHDCTSSTDSVECDRRHHRPGHWTPEHHIINRSKTVQLHSGEGWTNFYFGEQNTIARTKFTFTNKDTVYLKLTDFYCSGDMFEIYDNGKLIGSSSKSVFDYCQTKEFDATKAYYSPDFSSFGQMIQAGNHEITIKVLNSPYDEGYAAIRIDPGFLKCCYSRGNLTLIDTPMPFMSAELSCQSHGLRLADMNLKNLDDASRVVFGCAGAHGRAWVKSWNGDNYQNSCLALQTGSIAPEAYINTPLSCYEKLPVLCEGETHSCGHSFLRA